MSDGRAIHWIDGRWIAGNPPILGPMTHATWMASVVFDGARAFRGLAPDLDLHCRRVVDSARAMGLAPPVTADEIERLAWDGIAQFSADAELYVRPMMYSEEGFVVAVPESTKFLISVFEAPMPAPTGISACLSPYRRPAPDMATTDAKTASLYPNVARAMREARAKGFNTAVMRDADGNVAEFATANLFLVRDGAVATPVPNGTFLNGITRQRVIALLRAAGTPVEERVVRPEELPEADEIFATGNYTKVVPLIRYEAQEFHPGPVFRKARALYFDYAEKRGGRRPGL